MGQHHFSRHWVKNFRSLASCVYFSYTFKHSKLREKVYAGQLSQQSFRGGCIKTLSQRSKAPVTFTITKNFIGQ